MFFTVFISSIAQVLLKKSSMLTYNLRYREYFNIYVITGYLIFFLTTIFGIIIYKVIPLKIGPIAEATGYFWIVVFNFFIFNKKINLKTFIGIFLIACGIMIFFY